MSENGFWLAFWKYALSFLAFLALCITAGANSSRYMEYKETLRLIEAGYTRTTMPGVAGVYWTKEKSRD